MAYHHSLFDRIGGFDPALDVGTVTNGGGDLEMFFRVLQEGQTLVYEPSALVRHRHRRDYAQLRTQITNFGIGFSHTSYGAPEPILLSACNRPLWPLVAVEGTCTPPADQPYPSDLFPA